MKRVLIVDDAAFMRMSLKNMLERNGFQVWEKPKMFGRAEKIQGIETRYRHNGHYHAK